MNISSKRARILTNRERAILGAVPAVRTFLLIAVCALAIAGSVVFYGSPKGPVTDDPTLIRTWRASGLSAGDALLELRESGDYVIATTAGELAECGHWRSEGGSLHMRVRWSARGVESKPLLLWHPGLRSIHLACADRRGETGDAPAAACERWELTEHIAIPAVQRSQPRRWTLAGAAERPAIAARECGF